MLHTQLILEYYIISFVVCRYIQLWTTENILLLGNDRSIDRVLWSNDNKGRLWVADILAARILRHLMALRHLHIVAWPRLDHCALSWPMRAGFTSSRKNMRGRPPIYCRWLLLTLPSSMSHILEPPPTVNYNIIGNVTRVINNFVPASSSARPGFDTRRSQKF